MSTLTMPMFVEPQFVPQPHPHDVAFSCVDTDTEVLRNIMHLHNNGQPFDVDCAYSKGVMWRGLPEPVRKFDLAPQVDGVEQSDARDLPLADESVTSIAFDPPFLIETGKGSIIKERFSSFPSVDVMWGVYGDALTEFLRVLKPKGIVAFKCQSQVLSNRQIWSEEKVFSMAESRGFYVKDKMYRRNKSPMPQPRGRTQRHAQRNVSTWWVFRK